jgi:uncharacterized protein with ATP-grasp and redox domains
MVRATKSAGFLRLVDEVLNDEDRFEMIRKKRATIAKKYDPKTLREITCRKSIEFKLEVQVQDPWCHY